MRILKYHIDLYKIKAFYLKPMMDTWKAYSETDRDFIDREWLIDFYWLWFNLSISKP